MKKNKIQNIFIHRFTMPQNEKKEILEKLSYYHKKAIELKLLSEI